MPHRSCVDESVYVGIGALKHLDPSPWMRHREPGVMAELPELPDLRPFVA